MPPTASPRPLEQLRPPALPFSPSGWKEALQHAVQAFMSVASLGNIQAALGLGPHPERRVKCRKPGNITRIARPLQRKRVKLRRAELRRRTAQRVQQKQRARA